MYKGVTIGNRTVISPTEIPNSTLTLLQSLTEINKQVVDMNERIVAGIFGTDVFKGIKGLELQVAEKN